MLLLISILFVILFTGTGLQVILLIKAWPEVKRLWKKVKNG
jgi:hypothetical protein